MSAPSNAAWLRRESLPTEVSLDLTASTAHTDISITLGTATVTLRIDLATRERVLQADGDQPDRFIARMFAVRIASAKDRFDQAHPPVPPQQLPRFDADEPASWSSMQLLAAVTGGQWIPPRGDRQATRYARARRRFEQRRVNEALHRET